MSPLVKYRCTMDRVEFEQLVSIALDTLPDEFAIRLENIDVVVQGCDYIPQLPPTLIWITSEIAYSSV